MASLDEDACGPRAEGRRVPDVVIKEKLRAQESPLLQYRWPRAHMALSAPNSWWPLTSGTPMEPGAMTIFLGAGGGCHQGPLDQILPQPETLDLPQSGG